MKKTKLFAFALAALTLGACSSSDDAVIAEGGATQTTPIAVKGYIGVNINMPTDDGGRANDVFDDGEEAEWNVKTAKLVVFKKTTTTTSEKDYAYAGAIDLNKKTVVPQPNNEVTANFQSVGEVNLPDLQGGEEYYGLVILNNDASVFTGNQLNSEAVSTFNDFITKAISFTIGNIANTSDKGSFLMSNAPMSKAKGGTTAGIAPTADNITTLVRIDYTQVKSTQAEALANPAATFCVERAVAKVTVKNIADVAKSEPISSVAFKGWTLNQTNKKSFFVHNVIGVGTETADWWGYKTGSSNNYRFVSGSDTDHSGLYRTYWGFDPNYSSDAATGDFNTVSGKAPAESELTAMGNNQYCLENTFDVAHMKNNQSTYAVVAIEINGGDDFFTIDGNKKVIYKKDGIETVIKNIILTDSDVKAVKKSDNTGLSADDIEVKLPELSASLEDVAVSSFNIKGSVTLHNDNPNPKVFEESTEETSKYKILLDKINALKYAYYAGGVAYYPVLIRHFDDTETPWDKDNAKTNYGANAPYGVNHETYGTQAANDYLGRYGVLRNNWYELTVKKVLNIGEPVIPTPGDIWDDPTNSYLAVDIKILSWAKRGQEVEF